jgi:hypothetical protein
MIKDNLPEFEVNIDDEYSKGGEDLGIDRISFVKDPAVIIKGVAFKDANIHDNCKCEIIDGELITEATACDYCKSMSKSFSNIEKRVYFKDDKKYRIAAPAMVPMSIYRNDEDGEYFLKFTDRIIEKLAKKFMKNLSNKKVYNDNHGDVMVDAYILESILVDSEEKVKFIKSEYNVSVPKGTFFLVSQFNNKEEYERIVAEDKVAFSIEGFLGMEVADYYEKNKKQKMKMEEQGFVLPDGEHTIGDKVYTVKDGIIVSVVDVVEASEEKEVKAEEIVEEEEVEIEAAEEVKEEKLMDEELVAKFAEVYEMIAELKAELQLLKEPVGEEVEVDLESKRDVKQTLSSFLKFYNAE